MKKKLGDIQILYPTLTVLAGAMVNNKPTFNTIVDTSILNFVSPRYISLSMGKAHYTNSGIRDNGTFSVNIPSERLVAETDYCGIVSGRSVDKSGLFEIFYGILKTAPMIRECPLNMECRLYDIYDLPTHDVMIGEVAETYADESVLTDGTIDITEVRPLLFDLSSKKYWSLGVVVANAWDIGNKLSK
jgi:flavin reductase (DIM6/NTAB) family NADH-FMN oxidoreductase RutF